MIKKVYTTKMFESDFEYNFSENYLPSIRNINNMRTAFLFKFLLIAMLILLLKKWILLGFLIIAVLIILQVTNELFLKTLPYINECMTRLLSDFRYTLNQDITVEELKKSDILDIDASLKTINHFDYSGTIIGDFSGIKTSITDLKHTKMLMNKVSVKNFDGKIIKIYFDNNFDGTIFIKFKNNHRNTPSGLKKYFVNNSYLKEKCQTYTDNPEQTKAFLSSDFQVFLATFIKNFEKYNITVSITDKCIYVAVPLRTPLVNIMTVFDNITNKRMYLKYKEFFYNIVEFTRNISSNKIYFKTEYEYEVNKNVIY